MTEHTMTTREMSDHFGVTLRLLRFYEEKELLFPVRDGQRRLFGKRDRARLTLILRGQSYGFKLEEMRYLLGLYDSGQKQRQLREAHQAGTQHLVALKRERRRLDETIADLESRLFENLAQIENHTTPQARCA